MFPKPSIIRHGIVNEDENSAVAGFRLRFYLSSLSWLFPVGDFSSSSSGVDFSCIEVVLGF